MTKEDIEILYIDLCSRIPYKNTYIKIYDKEGNYIKTEELWEVTNDHKVNVVYDIDQVKPIIRPLSSMTREEEKDLNIIAQSTNITDICRNALKTAWYYSQNFDVYNLISGKIAIEKTNEESCE